MLRSRLDPPPRLYRRIANQVPGPVALSPSSTALFRLDAPALGLRVVALPAREAHECRVRVLVYQAAEAFLGLLFVDRQLRRQFQ